MHIEVILDVNRGPKKRTKKIELGMIPLHVVPRTAYTDSFFIRKAKAGQKNNNKKSISIPSPPPPSPTPTGSMGSLKKCSATPKYYAGILCKATASARCPAQPMARRRHE